MSGADPARALIRRLNIAPECPTRILGFGAAALMALALSVGATIALGDSSGTVTYTATETIPVPPPSNYAGPGGGDGWAIALSDTQVFNVFHHKQSLQIACHNQADASNCWPADPATITDGRGHGFITSGQPGMYLDQGTGRLYVYATRSDDDTGGVVCVGVSNPTADPTFCGFTALTAVGEAYIGSQAYIGSYTALGTPMNIGGRLYSFNYRPGAGVGGGAGGTENTLLCFDETTLSACAGQPYTVGLGLGAGKMGTSLPSPTTAAIGGQLIIPVRSTTTGDQLACWDPSTAADCTGSWPVLLPFSFAGWYGGPFPMLDSSGAVIGLCLPTPSAPCYDLTGATATSPANLAGTIRAAGVSFNWNGPGVTIGPRVYIPEWLTGVACFDFSTGDSCPGFPKQFSGLNKLYTVNADPQSPTCLWVNADSGSDQIQSFDAFTGGACGAIRVPASQFIVPQTACFPASYDSLQVIQPAPGTYTSGSVSFEDLDGNPILGASGVPLNGTGTASLAGLNLNTGSGGLPEFLITFKGLAGSLSQVVVKLTWEDAYNPACTSTSVTATPPTTTPASTVTVTTTTTTPSPTNTVTVTVTTTTPVTTTIRTASPTVPPKCPPPVGALGGSAVGPLSIGMTRHQARQTLKRYMVTQNRFDNFCLSHGWGIRLGYPTGSLLKTLAPSQRSKYKGRVVLALTANRYYALKGVRRGQRESSDAARLHLGKAFHVGSDDWYFGGAGYARGIVKVRHGVIQEVGFASLGLTQTRARERVFINSFDKF